MPIFKNKIMVLYHSTSRVLIGSFKIKGSCGYGSYFAKSKKDSKTFGDMTYKVKITPLNPLVINDNEIKNYNFFNISKESYDTYIKNGYDSIAWYKNGLLKEFIVLNTTIIKSRELICY